MRRAIYAHSLYKSVKKTDAERRETLCRRSSIIPNTVNNFTSFVDIHMRFVHISSTDAYRYRKSISIVETYSSASIDFLAY